MKKLILTLMTAVMTVTLMAAPRGNHGIGRSNHNPPRPQNHHIHNNHHHHHPAPVFHHGIHHRRVWIDGRYEFRIGTNGLSFQIWIPGHFETIVVNF